MCHKCKEIYKALSTKQNVLYMHHHSNICKLIIGREQGTTWEVIVLSDSFCFAWTIRRYQ